jgi:uncharacterized protein
MWLHIYLPIAGISIPIFLLLGIGLTVGFLSGMFGVGGGFLITPLLIMIGVPPTVAAASDSTQIIAATTSGTMAHTKHGNVDYKMGFVLLTGGILGSMLGVQIIRVLRTKGFAGLVIEITYIVLLAIIGFYMFLESLNNLRKSRKSQNNLENLKDQTLAVKPGLGLRDRIYQSLPFQVHFQKSGVVLPFFIPCFMGFFVGLVASILGIGGGFIMIPMMVYILGIPMHSAIGTNLFQEVFLCLNVAFLQAYYNQTVDIELALILLSGSTIGAQFGAKMSNKLNADQLKIILALFVLLVMVQICVSLLIKPDILFSLSHRH